MEKKYLTRCINNLAKMFVTFVMCIALFFVLRVAIKYPMLYVTIQLTFLVLGLVIGWQMVELISNAVRGNDEVMDR